MSNHINQNLSQIFQPRATYTPKIKEWKHFWRWCCASLAVLMLSERTLRIESFHDKHPFAKILSSRLRWIETITELVASQSSSRFASRVPGEFGYYNMSIRVYARLQELNKPCFCPLDMSLMRCLTFVVVRSTKNSFFPSCFTIFGGFSEGMACGNEEILAVGGMITFNSYQGSVRTK